MSECIFCKIINNEIPSKTIMDTDNIKVIMDINPNSDGHLLIIPKEHYSSLHVTPSSVINQMFEVYKILFPIVSDVMKCDGITIYENFGLHQEIEHTHLHLLPTYHDMQGIKFLQQGDEMRISELFIKLVDSLSCVK